MVAIGTNNYCLTVADCDATLFHSYGDAWGSMVNDVQNYVTASGRSVYESIAGASDIETWHYDGAAMTYFVGPQPTKEWLKGYTTKTSQPMFNYGALEACQAPGACPQWGPEDYWEMSSTNNMRHRAASSWTALP